MWNVSGITGAAPVWIETMNRLHRYEPSRKPNAPAGVIRQAVDIADIGRTQLEWFMEGTETDSIRHAGRGMVPKITYPVGGTVVALDPDIPPEDQKMFFEVEPAGSGMEWVLDGTNLGTAASLTPWAPQKGKHVLVLQDSAGRALASVTFEVRGN